jgi:hypothetical protein
MTNRLLDEANDFAVLHSRAYDVSPTVRHSEDGVLTLTCPKCGSERQLVVRSLDDADSLLAAAKDDSVFADSRRRANRRVVQ